VTVSTEELLENYTTPSTRVQPTADTFSRSSTPDERGDEEQHMTAATHMPGENIFLREMSEVVQIYLLCP